MTPALAAVARSGKDAAEPDLCAPVLPHPVCARITYENSRPGLHPLEQRWVAAAIVTRVDELLAIDAEARRQALSLEARHALLQHNHDRSWMRYKKAGRRRTLDGTAWGRAGQGLQLRAYPVGQAHALSEMSGTGVE